MAVAHPYDVHSVIDEFVAHAEVRQSVEWTTAVLLDPVSAERAKSVFDTFVDPAEIDRVFGLWRTTLTE